QQSVDSGGFSPGVGRYCCRSRPPPGTRVAESAGYCRCRTPIVFHVASVVLLSARGRFLRRRHAELAVGGCDHSSTKQGAEIPGRILQAVSRGAWWASGGEDVHI